METDRFDSELGEVSVSRTRIERDRSDSEEWERIKDNFSEEKLVDVAEFKDIEYGELEDGSIYPNIRLEIDGEWKRMFFHVGDDVQECFTRLKYRWRAFQQNH
ncbi:MAG: hypothetical protein V5A72_01645 [Candidatus Nanohaloarchaea archaeon]